MLIIRSREYDREKPVTLTGAVTKLEWTNPHARIYIDVKDESGNVVNWDCELGPPNGLMRQGWNRNSLQQGQVVTINGFLSKLSQYRERAVRASAGRPPSVRGLVVRHGVLKRGGTTKMIARALAKSGLGLVIAACVATSSSAQRNEASAAAQEQAELPLPRSSGRRRISRRRKSITTTSRESERRHEHTMATIPVWDGLWGSGNNTMPAIFLEDGTLARAWSPGAKVKEGVLTPAYEQHFSERRAEIEEYGQQRYDRLTLANTPACRAGSGSRISRSSSTRPKQTWMMNDFMNETRRIYIGGKHVNTEAQHSATGDSIGFWDGDKLVIWTKWVNPADYVRGMPLTSNRVRDGRDVAGKDGRDRRGI